jgi:hypothetical protein
MSGLTAMALAAALPPPRTTRAQVSLWVTMAHAIRTFLAGLEAEKRQRAMFPFDSPERFNWHYVPRRRQGLPLKAMTEAERAAAHQLLRATLSEVGYGKVVDIMRLEEVLRQSALLGLSRDSENYAWSIFHTSEATFPLGWRVEGHHLSLNFTMVTEKEGAVTPAFMGANPAEVRTGSLKGLRVLAREQDLAFELLQNLNGEQRQGALIATRSLGDIVSGPGRSDRLQVPQGLPLAEMNPSARERLLALIEVYVRNVRPEVAADYLQRIRDAGVDTLHFAWAGSFQPDQAHYYRVHGPTLLIEYDNTQNDANHIHTVWHDLRRDFGMDLLQAHYDTGHHRQ